jgi:Fic family protein
MRSFDLSSWSIVSALRKKEQSMNEIKKSKKQTILDYIKAAGEAGLTCEQVEDVTGFSHATTTGRIHDLRKEGLVLASPNKRMTTKGNRAVIYCSIENGKGEI